MRPESVAIKVSLSGGQVAAAPEALGLGPALRQGSVVFCEDVTTGLSPVTPLLALGVVLRIRTTGPGTGDSTVKFRPCRWSQLAQDCASDRDVDGDRLRIRADWSGGRRSLAASMTSDWHDDRLARVRSGDLPLAAFFSAGQRRFLERSAPGRVTLSAACPLPDVHAVRWVAVGRHIDGVHLSIRAERWTVDQLDLLELSVGSSADVARRDQQALVAFAARHGFTPDDDPRSKTQRVVEHLVAAALAQ